MILIADNLYVGSSTDERDATVGAILNVAVDLNPTRGWPLPYYHIGLVDGPGNNLFLYRAAVLALQGLLEQRSSVLVCCHKGESRSMSVAIMYVHMMGSGRGWDDVLNSLRECHGVHLPDPHPAHKEAFGAINWFELGMIE